MSGKGEGGCKGSRSGGVLRCDPGLGEGEELWELEGGIRRDEVSLLSGRLAIPQPLSDCKVLTGGQRWVAVVGGVLTSRRAISQQAPFMGERLEWGDTQYKLGQSIPLSTAYRLRLFTVLLAN